MAPVRRALLALGAVVVSTAAFGAALVTVPSASAAPRSIPAAALGAATPTPSPPTPSPQGPSAPGNLTAVARATSITLSWTASQPGCCAVERYYVSYKRAFNDIPEGSRTVTDTTVTITGGIQPATEYQFGVTARDTAGNVSPGATLTVVTPATDTGPDTVPPAAPTNLTGTATDSTVTLNWSASTDNTGVTGYRVYHFDGVFISTLVATVTGTTYTGPLRYGRNEFYVRAVDAAGNVSIATDTFTGPRGTVPPTPTPTVSPQPPSAPGNLTAVARTTSITVSWTPSQPGCCAIDSYEYSYMRAFDDVMLPGTRVNDTTVTITSSIQPATEYRFWVSARDVAGNRSTSAAITVVTPATDTGPDTVPPTAPTNLTGTATGSGSSIALSWSPSTDNVGVTGYRVYHYDGWFTSRVLATVTGTSYTAPLGSTGRNNYYVRAVDAAGNVSIASNVVNASTASPPPTIPPTTLPPTTPPAPTCQVSYATKSQWTGGFTASITIENTASTAVNGWTLAFAFGGDQRISTGWNATYSQTGAEVTARSLAWNSVIAPGADVSIGFMGAWTTSNPPPTRFTLNGKPCEVATV